MTELDLRKSPWNEGLGISGDFLDYQLYLLGCIVGASSSFEGLGNHALLTLRERFQEVEIGRILLTVAIAVRNETDQNPGRAENWLQGLEDDVGTLQSKRRGELTLSFREACNKIIHCLSINFHYASDNPRRGMALIPQVHLYGTKGKEEWRVTVDINKFIQVASLLT